DGHRIDARDLRGRGRTRGRGPQAIHHLRVTEMTIQQRLTRAGLALVTATALAMLAACGGADGEAFPAYDNSSDVEAYYSANPDFFRFATPADIPPDLVWENGADLPELG